MIQHVRPCVENRISKCMFRIDVCDELMKCWAVMEVREVAHLVDNDASDTTIRYADEMSVECDMSGRRT